MKRKTVRETALELLLRIDKQGGFSHLLIADAIKHQKIDVKDESLLTEIVYGTIERKLTLDFYMSDYTKKQKKMHDWVRMLLRLSVYQIAFLDRVPTFAVINEAVNIAKKRGHQGIASLVNGLLRNVDRHGMKDTSTIEDPVERLSVETSHPAWLIDRWVRYYGMDVTRAICEENITRKQTTIRVNQLKTNTVSIQNKLQQLAMETSVSPLLEKAIIIQKGNILKTELIETGEVTIQDVSSMLAAKVVEVEPGMQVLDACSAPGGKATFLGEVMQNKGKITAYDLHQNKIQLIQRNAARLGITNIKASKQDAHHLRDIHEAETFDRILVDAPCSGFGVIRAKPDIKYQKTKADITQLKHIQANILEQVAPLVKTAGKIVYSTCTIEKEENEAQIQSFLQSHQNFVVDDVFLSDMQRLGKGYVTPYGIQLFPQSFHSDGFFITRLVKRPL